MKALSGGERNRLLLARLFTRPANVLVLDEPTNDLDIETLELLEERLIEFAGTILLVSHDRRFLNNVVTSTLSFEGGGVVRENVGDYDDWKKHSATVRMFQSADVQSAKVESATVRGAVEQSATVRSAEVRSAEVRRADEAPAARRKRSYKEQREYEALPGKIEALEAEERELAERMAGPEFYKEGAEAIKTVMARVESIKAELVSAYERWSELEERS